MQKIRILVAILFVLVFQNIQAQTYWHNTFWGRAMVTKEYKHHWFIFGEYHYRRQNNFHISKTNIFENDYLQGARLTVGKRVKKWTFSVMPSYWKTHQILGNENDFFKTPIEEWRISPTVEFAYSINSKLLVNNRIQEDFRFFKDRRLGRFRERIQVRYFVNKTDFFTLGDEILIGTPPNSSKQLEQNQLSFLFQKRFTPHIETEMGYRHLLKNRRNSTESDLENALVFSLFYKL